MSLRNAAPPRGPRHSSPSVRGRGGISKHRAPLRTDKDGDLVMGAVVGSETRNGRARTEGVRGARGRGPGRAAGISRGSLGTQQAQKAILRGLSSQQGSALDSRLSRGQGSVQLRVRGLKDSKAASNPDGGLKDLLGFLERKASSMEHKSHKAVRIKKSYLEDSGDTIITVTADDSVKILKLNGFTFAGAILDVVSLTEAAPIYSAKDSSAMTPEAKETEDKIRAILSKRYDIELKLLNLSSLGQDEDLRSMGMFDAKNRITKLFPVLMAICDRLFKTSQQKRDAIVSVTLTDNELDGTTAVTSLAQTFPDLKNLDLSRNKFADLKSLEGWRWKFRSLELLAIFDNPITTTPNWTEEVVRWFPTLQTLNSVQVRTPEEVAAAISAVNKIKAEAHVSPIPIAGPDFRDVNQIGENFIRHFFSLYDNDRMTLANTYYDTKSSVSLSINMSAPRSKEQSAPIAPWATYIKHSRNLLKVTSINTRMARMYHGNEAIKALWAELPATEHPDLINEFSKYVVDCHPIPGLHDLTGQSPSGVDGLLLTVQGQFSERATVDAQPALRSFSRTFILGPGSGSMPIRVVSDVLVLRAWSPLVALTAAAAPDPTVNTNANIAVDEAAKKAELLKQLMAQTGMTHEYASMCMDGTGWDLERAFIAFTENKASLPPSAFTTTTV